MTPFIHVAFKRMQVPVKTDCYHVTNKREIEVGQTKTLEFEVALDANTEAIVLWSIQHYDYGTVSSVCLIQATRVVYRNEGRGWWGRERASERERARGANFTRRPPAPRACSCQHICVRVYPHTRTSMSV